MSEDDKVVRKERTYWRDERISALHRVWGWDCPAIDIDWLVIEYDYSEPKGVIEYKEEHAEPQYPSHPSYKALARLGDKADLPVYAVRYAHDFTKWRVIPLNTKAKNITPQRVSYTHAGYVEFLYKLRGRKMPEEVATRISTIDYNMI